MNIETLQLDEKHWSTSWIPISFKINKKSQTFLWSEKYQIIAICRAYYISNTKIEIGDVWVNEKYRGKRNENGTKYSVLFMREVISKIWKIYESVTKIGLIVDKENLPAIKLYQKLHFKKIKNITSKKLKISNGIYMERVKRLRTNKSKKNTIIKN